MTLPSFKSILVVDDDPSNLRFLRDILREEGYKVRACTTGTAALRGASVAPTDLILLDIKLPDYSGYDICQQLKADPQTTHIPIIFLSALTSTFDKVQGFKVGGADYVTKPFQIEELLARINTQLSLQRLQNHLQTINTQLIEEIEEHKRTKAILFFEKELAQVTLKSIGDGVITTNAEGYITYVNSVAEYLTGWNGEEAKGVHLFEVFKIVNELTKDPVINPITQALDEIRVINLARDTTLISRDGAEFAIDDSAAPIRDDQGNILGAVIIFRDVTASRNFTRQLSWQASHDALTGLVNRHGFEQALETLLAAEDWQEYHHVLCYLDLDQFKIVNDTCGHAAGDQLLRQVSKTLQHCIRENDTLARLGGDEFAFLLRHCSLKKAQEVAEKTRDAIEQLHFAWDDKIFSISVSIGVVGIDDRTRNKDTLLSIADAACYAAKGRGRNCIHVYQENDDELFRQRQERRWVLKIHQALEESNFCLYYQKVVPIGDNNKPVYNEILLRLINEEGKVISPGIFMPAAERYDLMPAIDRWVISHFFQQYNDYYQQFHQPGNMLPDLYALNISGASINNENFLGFLKEQILQTQIPPQQICFELTESTAIANFEQAIEFIKELKELGCCFAIDDFGHGMNSFEYIKHFPVDYLKIDGSFVKNIVHSKVDHTIVESFHRIGRVMNLETIAEFVENGVILEKLIAMGLDYAQGYEIAKPLPLNFEAIFQPTLA
ncbi:response regulator receiver modulated diguanylate cyclase/phosphodiesterase with PAS/PAC sensor(s) [Synechocystis sp. LKSZ1]